MGHNSVLMGSPGQTAPARSPMGGRGLKPRAPSWAEAPNSSPSGDEAHTLSRPEALSPTPSGAEGKGVSIFSKGGGRKCNDFFKAQMGSTA